jgi:TatD DNase family protein
MLIDAHSHLDRYDLLEGNFLESALVEIAESRIFTISNSMGLPSYRRNLEIGEKSGWVLPAFGVHPWNASQYVDCLSTLDEAIERCSMIGEIGLDHYFLEDASTYPAQRKVFEYFLEAAREQNKIINLHTKGAEKEVLGLLDQYDIHRAILHWYSGPLDILQELIVRGVYFTVGIEALYSKHVQGIAREIPANQLLTETDNPGGPKEFTGKPGMPGLVKDIYRRVAETRKTSVEAVVQLVHSNLLDLVRDDPWLAEIHAKLLKERPSCG